MTNDQSKDIIENRFELCLIASKRAKEILSGAPTNHDKSVKSPIIALDEIDGDELDIGQIKKNIATGDNIYQSEILDTSKSEESEQQIGIDKNNLFATENLDIVD